MDDDINLLLVKYRGENGIPTNNVTFNTLSNIYMNIESGDDRIVSDKNINVFNAPQTSYFAPYTVNFDGTVVPTGSLDYSSKISFISSYDQTFATSFTDDEFYGNVNYYWEEGYSKEFGARNMRRYIERNVEDLIASTIIDKYPDTVCGVHLDEENKKIKLSVI